MAAPPPLQPLPERRSDETGERAAQHFLVQLSEALRTLTDPIEAQAAASRLLGQWLQASRVGYAEDNGHGETIVLVRNYTSGVASIEGRHRYDDYGPLLLREFGAGRTVVLTDVANDPSFTADERRAYAALQLRATVSVPLAKAGRLRAVFFVHQDRPRAWTDDEVALIEATAERTWEAVERSRAERALLDSEERNRALIRNLPGGAAFVVDQDLRYRVAEGQALEAAGFKPEDFVGKTIFQALPPDLVAQYEPHYRAVIAGHCFEQEHEAHGRRYVSRGVPLRDAKGEVYAALVVSYDVTERRRAEEALRAAHDTFRDLVKNSPFGVYVVDADFRLVEVSAGAQKVFEHVRPLLDRNFAEVLRIVWPAPAATQFIERFRHTLATGEPYHSPRTVEHRHDLNEEQAYDWKIERLMLPDGRYGVVCHFYDLSERMRYEARLEQADRRKDEFLAMLAHELRNPLAPIRNALEILRIADPSEATVARTREMIERQVSHLTRLVDDLLDVSRVTQGKIRLSKTPLDLAQVAYAGVELARPFIDAKGHHLKLVLPPPGQLWIEGDGTRLAQVVSNLLNNAAKYTDPGGDIKIALIRRGAQACLEVSDTGIGIAPELLPYVFDVFTQAERTLDRAQGGLGIGLSLVKRLVSLHGGSVEATSAGPGAGSRFTVCLPLAGAPPARAPGPVADERTAPRRILIIEDSADAAESLGALLELHGHVVAYAHDGPAALQRAGEFSPEVCLVDIGLPGMDGYALAARLRAMASLAGARMIALSGYSPPEDRRRIEDTGFDEYLIKPVEAAALLKMLARALPSQPR